MKIKIGKYVFSLDQIKQQISKLLISNKNSINKIKSKRKLLNELQKEINRSSTKKNKDLVPILVAAIVAIVIFVAVIFPAFTEAIKESQLNVTADATQQAVYSIFNLFPALMVMGVLISIVLSLKGST